MERNHLEKLALGIQRCQRCERSRSREHAVPGEGSTRSGLLLVGEAPGKKEDRTGRPFMGRAGGYLEKVLRSNRLEKDLVYITSVLKCYHPGPPKKYQIQKCLSWSQRLIDSLEPKIILVMGKWAAWTLLDMENLREIPKVLSKDGKLWVVTCHPAAAMRFPRRDTEFRAGCALFASKAAQLNLA